MHALIDRRLKSALSVLWFSAVLTHAGAQTQSQLPESRLNPLVHQFQSKHGQGWVLRLSEDKKRIESVLGRGTYGVDAEPAAHSFLTDNAPMFGLRQDLSDLRVLSQHSSAAGGHVEFQQVVNGLPVENSRVQVNLNKNGRILQVVNNYVPLGRG